MSRPAGRAVAFVPWLLLAVTAPGASRAQPARDSRHQLGLFNDVLADTVTVRDGIIPVKAPWIRFRLVPNALPPQTGGGNNCAVAFDCDGDGRDEVLLGHGSSYPRRSVLLRCDRRGRFSPVAETGLPPYVGAAARGDLDNDGLCDLVVAGTDRAQHDAAPPENLVDRSGLVSEVPGTALLACRATGAGRFEVKAVAGPPAGHPDAAFWPAGGRGSWSHLDLADLDRDGRLDLVACEAYRLPEKPDQYNQRFWVFHNRGDRLEAVRALRFRDDGTTLAADMLNGSASGAIFDADTDGWPDLTFLPEGGFFALRVPVGVYRNRGGRFADRPDTLDIPAEPQATAPSWYDTDADGDFDLLSMLTDAQGGRHALYLNDGAGRWRSRGAAGGLWSAYSLMTGAAWGDFDQDGLPDLIPCLSSASVSAAPIQLRLNLGDGRFGTVAGAFSPPLSNALFVSLAMDVDGDLDLDFLGLPRTAYSQNLPAERNPGVLYRNESRTGHGVALRLVGTRSNRSAIGARVEVRCGALRQAFIVGGGGVAGGIQPPLELHVGLGEAKVTGPVTVSWPSGLVERWDGLAAGRMWTLTEGSGTTAN